MEFNQYEAFLRSIDDKIHQLRTTGKNEAAKRLEEQLILLRVKFYFYFYFSSIIIIIFF